MRSLAAILGALVATAAATVPDTSFLKIGEASRMLRASCGAKSVPHGRLLQSAGPECDLKLGDCALSSLTEGAWTTIRTKPVLVDDEMIQPSCIFGDEFVLRVWRGDPTKVAVFLDGGGACWSIQTCGALAPLTNNETLGFSPGTFSALESTEAEVDEPNTSDMPPMMEAGGGFENWTVIFVPYCTGDVFSGARQHTFTANLSISLGQTLPAIPPAKWPIAKALLGSIFDETTGLVSHTANFYGAVTVISALNFLQTAMAPPSELWLSGCSAGSVGMQFNAPLFLEYAKTHNISRVSVNPDSFLGVLPDNFQQLLVNVWGSCARVPDWANAYGFTPLPGASRTDCLEFDFSTSAYVRTLMRAYPSVNFGLINYQLDATQIGFYYAQSVSYPIGLLPAIEFMTAAAAYAMAGNDPDTFNPDVRNTSIGTFFNIAKNNWYPQALATLAAYDTEPNHFGYIANFSMHCALPYAARYNDESYADLSPKEWVLSFLQGQPKAVCTENLLYEPQCNKAAMRLGIPSPSPSPLPPSDAAPEATRAVGAIGVLAASLALLFARA